MRINQKILSIPPYISTSWKNIASLHVQREDELLILVINLTSGAKVEVPYLEPPIIEAIFAAHAKFMEQESSVAKSLQSPAETAPPLTLPLFRIGSGGMEGFGSMMQHNPEQAQLPDLPQEMLQKITAVAKAIGLEESSTLAQPEPHCNCMHCQILRALSGQAAAPQEEKEETVSDEDLKFRLWDIQQAGDKLYSVTSPIDANEQYSVYLGTPVGCTCGEKNCEHIRAVLST